MSAWLWGRARFQEGSVHQDQLAAAGLTRSAIRRRVETGRLHPKWPNVFAVGRPELSQRGLWVAALLTCGSQAALSDGSAIAYYELGDETRGIEVCVPYAVIVRRAGMTVHRRRNLQPHHIREEGPIRVTTPALTLIDFAAKHARDEVEEAINAAEWKSVIAAVRLRAELDEYACWPGVPLLRSILDRRTFRLTQSHLERLFIPIAVRSGLGKPLTQQWVNGYRVDFHWPELGLASRRTEDGGTRALRSKPPTGAGIRRTPPSG